ncbi:hypothetical protein OCL43_04130 [Neisseria gonorrhoeae]|uniref:hypothetical protein n=1 Tax=Neisseria gonorrhoeae TaxID=485 RepID=UPI0021D7C170|nr:hypothetical protein [Neisseria gonorrhoeae]UXY68248.1 hypothetical protein OCL43_04130 [Neisseria gonorrhoeae]
MPPGGFIGFRQLRFCADDCNARYSSGCRLADSSAFVNFGSVPMTVTPVTVVDAAGGFIGFRQLRFCADDCNARYSSGCRQADSSAFVNFGSVPMTVTPVTVVDAARRIHRLSSTSGSVPMTVTPVTVVDAAWRIHRLSSTSVLCR